MTLSKSEGQRIGSAIADYGGKNDLCWNGMDVSSKCFEVYAVNAKGKKVDEIAHVVHPNKVKWIVKSNGKTDKVDAKKLAELGRIDGHTTTLLIDGEANKSNPKNEIFFQDIGKFKNR